MTDHDSRIVYQVTLEVDAAIAADYRTWLRGHVAEMLEIDGFLGAEWLEREPDADPGESDHVSWTVQYRVRDRAALQTYFDEHAARMRAEGIERFQGRFVAHRAIYRVVS